MKASVVTDEEIINHLLEGELMGASAGELRERMLQDAQFRRTYLSYARTDHLLHEYHESTGGQIDSAIGGRKEQRTSVWAIAAAIALCVGLVVLITRGGDPELGSVAFGPESVGKLEHADGRVGGEVLLQGTWVELDRGTLSVKLKSGVEGLFEAPAEFEMVSDNRLRLKRGKAWFSVPKGAEGFVCKTEGLLIEDLGTEFGVVANEGRAEMIHVYDGKVRLHSESLPGKLKEVLSGETVSWLNESWVEGGGYGDFLNRFPEPIVVFEDNFEGANGSPLLGRKPEIGGSFWNVQLGHMTLEDGALVTRGSEQGKAFASLGQPRLNEHSNILLMTIEATGPGAEGWAGVSLYTGAEERIFVGDPNGPDGDWALHPAGGAAHNACPLLEGKSVVTLRYDFRTGLAELYEGETTTGKPLASQWIAPGLAFDRLRVANGSMDDALVDAGMNLDSATREEYGHIRSKISIRRIKVTVISAENATRQPSE